MIDESNADNSVEKQSVNSVISSIYDAFHMLGVSITDRYVLLLLLSLYKDNLISKDFVLRNTIEGVTKDEISNDLDCTVDLKLYDEITNCFSSSLVNIRETKFEGIINLLFKINRYFLADNFKEIFDHVLYEISKSQGRFAGGFILPNEVSRFIGELVDLPKKACVYNPFAGVASFGVNLDEDKFYYGQELSRKTWAIGMLRLMAYGKHLSANYRCEDSIRSWDMHKKYDLIIANPPISMRLNNSYEDIDTNYKTVEQFLLGEGVNSLNQEGKLIAILPLGMLFKGGPDQRIRQRLIDEDLVETVIILPAGLLMNTGIPLVVLVINKKKAQPQKVRFVDATSFVLEASSRRKVLDNHQLIRLVKQTENVNFIRTIDNSRIVENNYNLSVSRYFQEEIEGVKLADLITIKRPNRGDVPKEGKFIRISDLKNDRYNHDLEGDSIAVSELRKNTVAGKLSDSCLLVSMLGESLKPTYFKSNNDSSFIRTGIFAFDVNEKKVDKDYLINELQEEYVQKQIESMRVGAGMRSIRRDDLLQVVIKLPPFAEQKAKVAGLQQLSKEIIRLQEERNSLAHGAEKVQFDEIASLKHSIGAPRQNILSNAKTLIRFFERNESESFKEVSVSFAERYDIELLDVFKQVRDDINHISVMLEKGEKGLVLENYSKELVSLKEINAFVNRLRGKWDTFYLEKHFIKDDSMSSKGIECNMTLLRVLFDNILKNSQIHAFDDDSKSNIVDVDLMVVDNVLQVCIKNNGKAFPPKVTKQQFISKFISGDLSNGEGLGGYDINRIAKYFGDDDWALELDPTVLYPVVFKFQFSIKSL